MSDPDEQSFQAEKQWCQQATSDPVPFEFTDPDLAEHIRLVVHRQHPFIRTIEFHPGKNVYVLRGGRVRSFRSVARNDQCPCGSGKKFKKCCGVN